MLCIVERSSFPGMRFVYVAGSLKWLLPLMLNGCSSVWFKVGQYTCTQRDFCWGASSKVSHLSDSFEVLLLVAPCLSSPPVLGLSWSLAANILLAVRFCLSF